jgi:chromosome segregation ATPase
VIFLSPGSNVRPIGFTTDNQKGMAMIYISTAIFSQPASCQAPFAKRVRKNAFAMLGVAVLMCSAATVSRAEVTPTTPLKDFNTQTDEMKQTLQDAGREIDRIATELSKLTAADAAAQKVAELQGVISDTLAKLSDNSPIATSTRAAMAYINQRLRQAQENPSFEKEIRADFVAEWQATLKKAEASVADLEKASAELVNLLRTAQVQGDIIEERIALVNANKATEAIQRAAAQIRSASIGLKEYLRQLGSPRT